MALQSGEVPVGYNTWSQRPTFHKPTFMYVTAKKENKLQNFNTEFWN